MRRMSPDVTFLMDLFIDYEMDRHRLRQLLIDYTLNRISDADLQELLDCVSSDHNISELDAVIGELQKETLFDNNISVRSDEVYKRIVAHPGFEPPVVLKRRRYWVYGAAAVLLFACGITLLKNWQSAGPELVNGVSQQLVTRTETASPTDKPILRLADGRIVDLDKADDGLLTVENGTQIHLDGYTLSYGAGTKKNVDSTLTNTIMTPKGRQYQLQLPDGSTIMLNAATTVTFPVRFNQHKREVFIDGEAYFEVKRAADWPFVVNTSLQTIEVLGTEFNVNAYREDRLERTTLVIGGVKVTPINISQGQSEAEAKRMLRPGEQAISDRLEQDKILVNVTDKDGAVAWKSNLFVFNGEEISEVMKQVTRWYDVEVVYKDGMAGNRIGGSIPRFQTVGELMDALAATGLITYRMEGRRVIIMK